MARPIYDTRIKPYLNDIEDWLKKGATHKEIAGKLHVSLSAYYRYRDWAEQGDERYKAFGEILKRASEPADKEVECALHKRACGIWWDEEVFELRVDRQTGEEKEVRVKRTRRYTPPDPTSAIFWLTNRKPKDWRSVKMMSAVETENAECGVVELSAVRQPPKPPKEGQTG